MLSQKFWSLILILMVLMIWKFLKNYVHMMNLLVILECLMLVNFLIVMFLISSKVLSLMCFLFLFMVNVMEACVGLGMLIYLSRNIGEEYKFIL